MRVTSYIMAMLMIFSANFILHFYFGIKDFETKFYITTYMIIYGALMSLSAIKFKL